MSQLYTITEDQFNAWLNSNPGEADLREALYVTEAKRNALFTPGHVDSYHHDRYDRDARYVERIRLIKAAIASIWAEEGWISKPELIEA
jgi:hypothetical protein